MTRTDAILEAVRTAVESKRAWLETAEGLQRFTLDVRMTRAGVVRCVLVDCPDEIDMSRHATKVRSGRK